MVDTTQFTKGDYLNGETCKEGDIVTILGEGEVAELVDKRTKKVKMVLNMPVKVNEAELIFSPTRKMFKMLQEIFKSTDSSKWVGQKFQVHIIDMEVAGKELKVVRPRAIK